MCERFDKDLLPFIGKLPIATDDAPLLRGVLDRIYERGARYLAGRTREYAGAVFRFGIARNLCRHDPAHDLREEYPHKVRHMPAIVDPAGVAALLSAVWDYGGTVYTRNAFRLVALTALRPGELRHLEWSEVDLARKQIRITATKMKMDGAQVVPLSRQAVAVLEDMEPLTGTGAMSSPITAARLVTGRSGNHCAGQGMRGQPGAKCPRSASSQIARASALKVGNSMRVCTAAMIRH